MTHTVVVRQPQPVIVREPSLLVRAGAPGPRGEPGGPHHVHEQLAPAAEWVINHNLGLRPVIAVHGPGGASMLAAIVHVSDNQARVYFDAPVSGYAVCT